MAFDGYNQYLKDQRKQRRWDRILLPIVLAAILVVMAIGFHAAYVRSHATQPKKPAAHTVQQVGTIPKCPNVTGCVQQGATVWYSCNAGMEVTDLADCPEYSYKNVKYAFDLGVDYGKKQARPRKHKRKTASYFHIRQRDMDGGDIFNSSAWPPSNPVDYYNPHQHVTLQQMARLGQGCILMIDNACWVALDPEPTVWPVFKTCETEAETGCTPKGNIKKYDVPGAALPASVGPAPDCKMPADVDVCPTNNIDRKGSHD